MHLKFLCGFCASLLILFCQSNENTNHRLSYKLNMSNMRNQKEFSGEGNSCNFADFSQNNDTSMLCTELEVARLSTEGNLEDLKFPENMGHGSTIQLSANTLKQNGRNGKSVFVFCATCW